MDEKYRTRLDLAIKPYERQALEYLAEKHECSMSGWIRNTILETAYDEGWRPKGSGLVIIRGVQ